MTASLVMWRCGCVLRLAVLALLLGPPSSSAAVQGRATIKATMWRHLFIIPAKVDGLAACLLVDTGFSGTMVWHEGWDEVDRQMDIEIGNIKIPGQEVSVRNTDSLKVMGSQYAKAAGQVPPVVGLLGRNVLRKFAVGFDIAGETVTFWKGGLSGDQAKSWVDGTLGWPAAPSGYDQAELKSGSSFYTVSANWDGSKESDLLLDSGATDANLFVRPPASDGDILGSKRTIHMAFGSIESESRLRTRLRIAGSEVNWWHYDYFTDRKAMGAMVSVDGMVSLLDLRTSAVILDLPNSKLYAKRSTPDERLSLALISLVGIPIRVSGSGLFRLRLCKSVVSAVD